MTTVDTREIPSADGVTDTPDAVVPTADAEPSRDDPPGPESEPEPDAEPDDGDDSEPALDEPVDLRPTFVDDELTPIFAAVCADKRDDVPGVLAELYGTE